METSLLVWLLPTLALIVGVAIGFAAARLLPNTTSPRTQRQLEDIQERFDNYQNEVVSHFSSTAAAVTKLTQAYQEVQENLAEGASRLATDDLTRQRLTAALSAEAPRVRERERLTPPRDSEAPKDYAPKAPNSPGMLDEQYGLKR